MILYPNAKINIGLDILHKRADGFHDLETAMVPVGLTDILTINKNSTKKRGINFSTTGLIIDGNSDDNLIVQAYNLINSKYKLPALDIHLHKSIPFGAGLGGGSADCAFTITGINNFCKLNLSVKELEAFAAELGSDCAFFIQNRPAIARGRGEQLQQIDLDLTNYFIVIAIPPIPISTKTAYSLVKPHQPKLALQQCIKNSISHWKTEIKNDFEHSVFSKYPEIQAIKNVFYDKGAIYSALSGSGSAVFGVFDKKVDLKSSFPDSYFTWHSD